MTSIENAKTIALDLREQRAVDRSHDQAGALRPAIDCGECRERLVVELAGALHLKSHQCLEFRGDALLEQLGARDAEPRHLVLRQIDAAAPRVFADVANDIGELKRDSEIACVSARGIVGITEDLRRHQSHNASDAIAIALEQGEIGIPVEVKVHGHPIDDCEKMLLRQAELLYDRFESLRDGMLWHAAEDRGDLRAPPFELDPSDCRIEGLVDRIVDFAAERIERDNRAPPLGRQEAKAVIEARAARGVLLFAISVGVHEDQGNKARADIAAQSPRDSIGRWRNTSPLTASIERRMRKPPATTILSSSLSLSGNACANARPDSSIARVRSTSNAINRRQRSSHRPSAI